MVKVSWPYEGMIEKIFLPYFQKHGEPAIKYLVEGRVSKRAFMSAYRHLPPIEEMAEKEKTELKQYVIDLFPGKSVEELVDCCRLVYTIGTLV